MASLRGGLRVAVYGRALVRPVAVHSKRRASQAEGFQAGGTNWWIAAGAGVAGITAYTVGACLCKC